ncbi:hypothetical protein [Parasitella parasitica]|uniref:Uncharacterized protein n=1 Tax=Parasitella parasitica TaxID=35722 RepID=A0A0B7NXD3_9FUNG|nr:hypothetical protein [Parasitella parasitica]
MPSTLEKKNKKSSSSNKKSKKALPQDLNESVVPTSKSKMRKVPVNDATEVADAGSSQEDLSDSVKNLAQEAQADLNEDSDDDAGPFAGNTDAMTLMNAITEYNRMLMKRLSTLEDEAKEQGEQVNKQNVRDTVQNTYNDVKNKYDKKVDNKGTHHSFELPLGDMLHSFGKFDSSPLEDDEQDQEEKPSTYSKDEESTVHNGDDAGKISIGNGDKDDIVVKVEATKTGITFCIHIPRN